MTNFQEVTSFLKMSSEMEAPGDMFEIGRLLMAMLQKEDSVESVMSFLENHEREVQRDTLLTMLAEDVTCMLAVRKHKSYVADVVRAAKAQYGKTFPDILEQSLKAAVDGAHWSHTMKCRVAKFMNREMGEMDRHASVTNTDAPWLSHTEVLFKGLDKSYRRLVKEPIMHNNRNELASVLCSLTTKSTFMEQYAIWSCVKHGAFECLGYIMTCLENSRRYLHDPSERSFRIALEWFCYLNGDVKILSALRQAGMVLHRWMDGQYICEDFLDAAIQGHNTDIVTWMIEKRVALPPAGMRSAIRAHNYEVLSTYWRNICVYVQEEKRLKELIGVAMESNFPEFVESMLPHCSDLGAYLVQEAIKCDSFPIQDMILRANRPLLYYRLTPDGDTVAHMLARKNSERLTLLFLELVGSDFCILMYQDNGRSKTAWQVAQEEKSGFDISVRELLGLKQPLITV